MAAGATPTPPAQVAAPEPPTMRAAPSPAQPVLLATLRAPERAPVVRPRQQPLATSRPAPVAAEEPIPQDDVSRALLDTIRGDRDPGARRAAIDRWTDEARPLQPLMDAVFSDPDPMVRRWAALAIGRKARPEHKPALLQASRSESDPAVRRILEQVAARFPS